MSKKNETNSFGLSHQRDAFSELDDKEYEKLIRKSPWINHSMAKDDLEHIQAELVSTLGRPLNFSPSVTQPQSVDIPRLYQEIQERLMVTKITSAGPLLHQCTKKSTEYRTLFRWRRFSDLTEPFLKTLHYQMEKEQRVLTEQEQKSGGTLVLQTRLVLSYQNAQSLTLHEMTTALESHFESILMKYHFFKDLVVFCFEWPDPEPFVFLVLFESHFEQEKFKRLLSHTALTFSRKDLMDDGNDEETLVVEELDSEMPFEKEVVRDDLFTEKGDETFRHLSTENFEQELLMRQLYPVMQQVPLSYLYSAYAKRD